MHSLQRQTCLCLL